MDYTCHCGRTYHFPDAAVGKRARCKSCGEVFTVAAEEPEFQLVASARTSVAPASLTGPQPATAASHAPKARPSAQPRPSRVQRSFWLDALYSFTIFSKPANIGSLIGCAILLFLAEVVGLLPVFTLLVFILQLFLHGAVIAFFLDVVRTTAGGDDELPAAEIWGDYWDGVFRPLLEFTGATLLLLAPAIVTVTYLRNAGAPPDDVKLWGTVIGAAGLFLWPIVILAIAVGGVTALIRIDLLLLTILKTLPAYLAILGLMTVAVAIGIVATGALTQTSAAQQLFANPSLGAVLATQAALSVAGAYVSIVCMRAIGLYYRHFSERFPWTAG